MTILWQGYYIKKVSLRQKGEILKKVLLSMMLLMFSGCLSTATRDQCRKACFNQVAIQETINRAKPEWEKQIQALKAARQRSLDTLRKQQAETIVRLKKADRALADANQKDTGLAKQDGKDIKKTKKEYKDLITKVNKKYTDRINKVREAKLKVEIKTEKRVKAAIGACIGHCQKQKWSKKQVMCVSGAKTPDDIRKCF